MADIEALKAAAFRGERHRARELARRVRISEEEALRRVLEEAAHGKPLKRFLERRQRYKDAAREQLAQRLAQAESGSLGAAGSDGIAEPGFREPEADGACWRAWFDGACRPNPGTLGIGAILEGPRGERLEISRAIGEGTNSHAEYHALIELLEAALAHGAKPLIVYGDAQHVIHQVLGARRVTHRRRLCVLCERARALVGMLVEVRLVWMPKKYNKAADRLSRQAIRQAPKAPVQKRRRKPKPRSLAATGPAAGEPRDRGSGPRLAPARLARSRLPEQASGSTFGPGARELA